MIKNIVVLTAILVLIGAFIIYQESTKSDPRKLASFETQGLILEATDTSWDTWRKANSSQVSKESFTIEEKISVSKDHCSNVIMSKYVDHTKFMSCRLVAASTIVENSSIRGFCECFVEN